MRQPSLFQEAQSPPTASPFFAWVGGKRQLLSEILPRTPSKINRYYEPFVGGGALMWELANRTKPIINDLNPEITDAYTCIKNPKTLEKLIGVLNGLKSEYNNLPTMEARKAEFLAIRAEDRSSDYNSWPTEYRIARFLFLNRTAFNGVYRLNRKGYFNTSFGFDRLLNFDTEQLRACHEVLQNVEIRNGLFSEACRDVRKGDFVYLDPPYDPVSKTSDFSRYTSSPFGKKEQKDVYDLCKRLNENNINFMVSNSNTDFIRNLYREFNVHIVSANRIVNSKGSKRGAVSELLITNY